MRPAEADHQPHAAVAARTAAADGGLLGIADRVAAAGIPPMAMEDIVAEVKAARVDRRLRERQDVAKGASSVRHPKGA